ncbi:MAG TPA: hypothetical protein VG937_18220 [Polyangiaceae bacterium]|jgi:hypothetical protein|nr:hypothetical protein [Polyangiaceae bacterium]
MRQETLTVVARVSDVTALHTALAALGTDRLGVGARCFQPRVFADARLGIHFARLAWLPGETQDGDGSLVFELNFDTELAESSTAQERQLSELAEREYPALASVFRHCEDFPLQAEPARLTGYCLERLVPATAAYQGHGERSLARIRLERAVHQAILSFFEQAPRASASELYSQVRDHLRKRERSDPELHGLDLDGPAPATPSASLRSLRLSDRITPWLWNIVPALPLIPQIPRILNWGRCDSIFDTRARQEAWQEKDRELFTRIADSEDRGVQNALTHFVALRSGEKRGFVLATAHAYIDRMVKAYFNDTGQLGGIPSIHFAKWVLLDEGRRLLFLSNYDNSWESYLGDFVDQAAIGLNLAWACTEGYPKTRLLALDGADDEERFKAWGRAHQLPTQVFYSAYPDLSLAAINNNTWIRQGLHERPGAAELGAWFRRLT